ncbi:tyrosine-type recombinase/integrase [Aestuariivirga sp.]|uniref:tyrosine-type recombinase/integrase n=1 Tax=Aestuariivirga sp. TaxID=2650926 RepID=UPI003594309B
MAGKLNARKVETLTKPGRHADGNNLYLFISPNGGKRWTFFYRFGKTADGKPLRREMGLGGAARGQVSLAEAREKALEARKLLSAGADPLEARKAAEKAGRTIPTFGTFADDYLKSHRPGFKNAKHIAQWELTLSDAYCRAIRAKPVNEIDTEAILSVLKPIWHEVPETASRLRGRIENILDAARALGYRDGPNPATWRGHLKSLLPARQKLTRGHHAALAYDGLPAFMAELRARQSSAALALELCILTATRSSEVLNAEWTEFDLDKAIWIIPAHRMKAGHAHRIPLTERAVDLLKGISCLEQSPFVFPGTAKGKPLSCMAMTMQLRRMKRDSITVHGFRSTFRDWASEQTSFPHETCEHALAHRISDKAEAA